MQNKEGNYFMKIVHAHFDLRFIYIFPLTLNSLNRISVFIWASLTPKAKCT